MNSNILKSKWFRYAAIGVGEVIILLLVFKLGMVVGTQKSDFERDWAQNYGRFFGEPRRGFFPGLTENDSMNPFGNAGSVLSINGNMVVVKSNNNVEKIVLVGTSTVVREGGSDIDLSAVKIGDPIVVIGSPNASGQIEARFVRIFPAPDAGR